jgi:hypothetical protein
VSRGLGSGGAGPAIHGASAGRIQRAISEQLEALSPVRGVMPGPCPLQLAIHPRLLCRLWTIVLRPARNGSAFERPTGVGVVHKPPTSQHGTPRAPARALHTSTPFSLRRCPSRSERALCTKRGTSAIDVRHRASIADARHRVATALRDDPGHPRANSATSPRCTCRNSKDQDFSCAGLGLRVRGIASTRRQQLREHESRSDPALGVASVRATLPRRGCGVRMQTRRAHQ